MNNVVKEEWIKALRSGEYKQGVGQLKTANNEYCCLGVLCDVNIRLNGGGEWRNGGTVFVYKNTGCGAWLPEIMLKDLNLSNGQQVGLMSMNDGGKNFKEIADYIEENL